MTVEDVIKMVQVKLADDLIIAQVRQNPGPLRLTADDLVRLKTAGVSDGVIRAMLEPRGGARASEADGVSASRPEESLAKQIFAAHIE